MSYQIVSDKISDWINKWGHNFDSITPDPSSIKTLVYLVLLERQNELSSYEDIAGELTSRGVISGKVEDLTLLRNAMFQIVKALEEDKLYEIENTKIGKQAFYRIKKRDQSDSGAASDKGDIISFLKSDSSSSMEYIAERLMRDRRMPFYGIYLPMQAASRWVLYSEEEEAAGKRSKYEGEQCMSLLGRWMYKYRDQEISLLGLGVGEGIGEIEILDRVLNSDLGFKRIHYCAVDTNIHLLLDHTERLRDKFNNEIRNKRLVCGIVRGNFMTNFSDLIKGLRDEFRTSGQFAGLPKGFLPPDSGTIVSILGNLIGNVEKRASEWEYFQPVLEALQHHDLAFLLGVSVQQKDRNGKVIKEPYKRTLDDLLLATPKYLTQDLRIITSHQPEDSREDREFVLPKDEDKKKERCPSVEEATYQGDGLVRGTHIKGSIYEFYYKTQWDLSMKDKPLSVPSGTELLLYNIIKFDLSTLFDFLESRSLLPVTRSISNHVVKTGDGDRVYAVFAVTTSS